MPKLTDTQVIVLTSAANDLNGLATLPDNLKPAAAAKVAAHLIAVGYIRELRAKADGHVWRQDKDGKAYSLKILKAGRDVIGARRPSTALNKAPEPVMVSAADRTPDFEPRLARSNTKIGEVVALLEGDEGATLNEMIALTDWLPHTMRAALSGLRKRGYSVERGPRGDGVNAYRIVGKLLHDRAA